MKPDVCQYFIQLKSPGPLYQLLYIPSGATALSGELRAPSGCEPSPKMIFGTPDGGGGGGVFVGGGGSVFVAVGGSDVTVAGGRVAVGGGFVAVAGGRVAVGGAIVAVTGTPMVADGIAAGGAAVSVGARFLRERAPSTAPEYCSCPPDMPGPAPDARIDTAVITPIATATAIVPMTMWCVCPRAKAWTRERIACIDSPIPGQRHETPTETLALL
jgi:hypothetical protein